MYQQQPATNQWAYWGADANQAMVAEFVASIRESRQPAITGEDGLEALRITLAAYESVETGQPVSLTH